MRKIKLLHALVRVGSGGVEQTCLSLAKHLDRGLFEQRVVCSDSFGGLPSELEDAGCPVYEVGVLKHPFDPGPHSRVLKIIREFKPDIILGEPGQPQDLADAFLTLYRSPDLRLSMGQKGREKALAEFGEERYVREVGDLYHKLGARYLPA